MKLIQLTLILIFTSSCAYVASVSQTSIPKDKSKMVEAKVTNNIIFLFNFNNDYIDDLTKQLMDQCPNGSVKGILTKDENITYFPIIFHRNVITAKGYCVSQGQPNKKKRM